MIIYFDERKRGKLSKTQFYKNCRNVRKRHGKCCQDCPFREAIRDWEKFVRRKK
jgi:hypothetical protein